MTWRNVGTGNQTRSLGGTPRRTDPSRLGAPKTRNLHERDLVGRDDLLHRAKVPQQAIWSAAACPRARHGVMAHETGHLLLGNRGHTSEGLMRVPWSADDWQRASSGILLFSGHESETMRATISSCR